CLALSLSPPSASLFPYTTLFRSHWLISGSWIHCHSSSMLPRGMDSTISFWNACCCCSAWTVFWFNQAFARTAVLLLSRLTRNNSDRKSTRLNSSHVSISYAVFCL